MNKPNDIKQ